MCPPTPSLFFYSFFLGSVSLQGALEARDYYVPSPSCKVFHKYEWIGQLMGAALRGKDFLVSDSCLLDSFVSFSAKLNLLLLFPSDRF